MCGLVAMKRARYIAGHIHSQATTGGQPGNIGPSTISEANVPRTGWIPVRGFYDFLLGPKREPLFSERDSLSLEGEAPPLSLSLFLPLSLSFSLARFLSARTLSVSAWTMSFMSVFSRLPVMVCFIARNDDLYTCTWGAENESSLNL